MRRKIRYDRLILVVLIALMAIVVLVLGIKVLFFNGDKENVDPTESPIVEVSDNLEIKLDSYEVFSASDLDFRFILANFTFQNLDNKAIDFDLSLLETNELIQLNNIDEYLNALQAANYSYTKMGINREVKSNEASLRVKFFIPVEKEDADTLTLSNLKNSAQFTFDLNQNMADISLYRNASGETISDGKSYDIYVSNAYVSSSMYRGDEQYTYPSTIKVYTFKLTVNELGEDGATIEEAYFVPDGSTEEYAALDASFSSMKDDNILGVPLKVNDTYALFFEIYNPDDSGISYSGVLRLKFAGSNAFVEISTTLD